MAGILDFMGSGGSGLSGLLGGSQDPSELSSWYTPPQAVSNNQQAILAAGMGLLSGRNNADAWGNALQGMQRGAMMDTQRNQTKALTDAYAPIAEKLGLPKGMANDPALMRQIVIANASKERPKLEYKDGMVFNPSTGELKPGGGNPGRFMTPEEKTAQGIDPKATIFIGADGVPKFAPAGTSVNVNNTPEGKANGALTSGLADEINTTATDGKKAAQDYITAQNLGGLLKNIKPGMSAGIANGLRKWGVQLTGDEGDLQAVDALLKQQMVAMPHLAGSQSNFDAQNLLKALPDIWGTERGNSLIMQTLGGNALMRQEAAKLANQARLLIPQGKMSYEEYTSKAEELYAKDWGREYAARTKSKYEPYELPAAGEAPAAGGGMAPPPPAMGAAPGGVMPPTMSGNVAAPPQAPLAPLGGPDGVRMPDPANMTLPPMGGAPQRNMGAAAAGINAPEQRALPSTPPPPAFRPSPAADQILMQNINNPQIRAAYDAKFGPGASDRAIQRMKGGQ